MSKPGVDPTSGISSGDVMIRPERHPACRRREPQPGTRMERANLPSMPREKPQAVPTARAKVPKRSAGAEQPVVVTKAL
jgi:hypothetical protein